MKKIDKGLEITKTKKVGGVVVSSETTVEPSPVVMGIENMGDRAEVGYKRRRVINMGNFESEHVEVSLVLLCPSSMRDKAYVLCESFVESRLEDKTDEILSNRAKDEF